MFGEKRARRDAAAKRRDGFVHSSGHDDLEALVDEHILNANAVEATTGWFPSRRGNSPRTEKPKR